MRAQYYLSFKLYLFIASYHFYGTLKVTNGYAKNYGICHILFGYAGVYQFPYMKSPPLLFFINRIDRIVPFMRKCMSTGNTLAESLKMFGITI